MEEEGGEPEGGVLYKDTSDSSLETKQLGLLEERGVRLARPSPG